MAHTVAGARTIVAPVSALPDWERIDVLRAEAEYASVRKDVRVAYGIWVALGIFVDA
jgi:hypothetical protein